MSALTEQLVTQTDKSIHLKAKNINHTLHALIY